MRRIFLLIAMSMALSFAAKAQTVSVADNYIMCSFYPAPGICEQLYQQAEKDGTHPAAASLRAEYENYARYLGTEARSLSPDDVAWLSANRVTLPDMLSAEQLGALHTLMKDPALQNDNTAKYRAVHGFLGRAAQAHLYCVFNKCPGSQRSGGVS